MPRVHCAGNHPTSPRSVRAAFSPADCHHHGNNEDPHAGRAYVTREDLNLLIITRRNVWTQDTLEEMVARDLEEQMERVRIDDQAMSRASSR
ncbi:hypothetical protein PPTG_19843 [Phytophthora nicotianae INRA-310]|uniref:Uncharacterized protein n=1 Tax=Phytophthora nicotianae (strain INRA-310) TaxID=761204 RepID=W2PCU1_PHYN3|nr:hypothetical protein PPTG_19843 [Phytophthora nicotianae INRA-310]ETM98043.1 hypothetical protein PPTG_19843 [Phytophthora nicotianae INRA-310]